jgi:WhiB family redox-sensing transcriptional regulator
VTARQLLRVSTFPNARPYEPVISKDTADETVWQDRANCATADPEIFYPEKGGSTFEAKKVCKACDVREECLQDALARDDRYGIYGGLSERQRRKLSSRRIEVAA